MFHKLWLTSWILDLNWSAFLIFYSIPDCKSCHDLNFRKYGKTVTEDGNRVQQFDAIMFAMNELGLVVNFCLTKTKSLQLAKPMLERISFQSPELSTICTGGDWLKILFMHKKTMEQSCPKKLNEICRNHEQKKWAPKTAAHWIFLNSFSLFD